MPYPVLVEGKVDKKALIVAFARQVVDRFSSILNGPPFGWTVKEDELKLVTYRQVIDEVYFEFSVGPPTNGGAIPPLWLSISVFNQNILINSVRISPGGYESILKQWRYTDFVLSWDLVLELLKSLVPEGD